MEQINVQALKEIAGDVSVLYAEDNAGLRVKVAAVLKKIFTHVEVAQDGRQGLEFFRRMRPKIVMADLTMPGLGGLELTRRIRKIDASVKVVVVSAHDDKPYLFEAIESGVFHFLKKPFSLEQLTEVLLRAVTALNEEENRDILTVYMHDMLNYQSNLLLLLQRGRALFANRALLDFFEADTLEECRDVHGSLGRHLEPHKGFLYEQEGISWFDQARLNPDKLFHVKIKDRKMESHHFILKLHPIPDKPGYAILSLNDITELNLLSLFDERATQHDRDLKDKAKLLNLFDVVRCNSAKVKILNFYKGLTIANDAVVSSVANGAVTLKTNFLQQKAIQFQKTMVITSEAFPMDVFCGAVTRVDFETQEVTFSDAKFSERSPSARKNVRVVPEESHTVTLFYQDHKYTGQTRILDLSVTSVKIELDALLAGLKVDEEVVVDMVLPASKMPLIVNTKGRVFRVEQNRYSFNLVIILELKAELTKQLSAYIAKRQMDLIREFKGMQCGK